MSGRTPDAIPYSPRTTPNPMTSWYGRIRCFIGPKPTRRSIWRTKCRPACKAPTVTIIRIADFPFEVPDSGVTLRFEVCGFGVRTGDRRIVIDPWLAFDPKRAESDGPERWARISAELRAADLAPGRRSTPSCTPISTVSVGRSGRTTRRRTSRTRATWSRKASSTHSTQGRRVDTEGLKVLRDHDLVDPIEAPHELAPGVTFEPWPGHTPSSGVVRVRTDEDEAVFVGHLFLHPAQVRRYERAETRSRSRGHGCRPCATARRCGRGAASCSMAICGSAPGCGKVTKDGDRYDLI